MDDQPSFLKFQRVQTLARRLRTNRSKAEPDLSRFFISNTGVPIMQQLIQQLTHPSVHSAGYPRGAANRRRRLALTHIECTAPVFEPPAPSRRRGVSNQATLLTTILGLFALALMALALYQWTLILQQQTDIERVRRANTADVQAGSSSGIAS